jgi:predicted acetyltransferase
VSEAGESSNAQVGAVRLESVEHARASVLNQLFELYAHDFSEYVPLQLKASGRFEVAVSELWWTRDDHHPFFTMVNGRLAGFALARRGSKITGDTEVMDVAEFFVVRGERRKGVGQCAAQLLLTQFAGRWEVRVRQSNAPALAFWSRLLGIVAVQKPQVSSYSAADVAWHVLRAEVR